MHGSKRKLAGGLMLGAALSLAAAPVAGAAKVTYPRRGAGFVGNSSQKSGNLSLPVGLRASMDGRTMSRFDIQWSATCMPAAGGMGSYGGLSITLNKKILPPGSFTDSNAFNRTFSDGTKGQFTIKVFGRFTSPTRVAGNFRVTVAVTDAAGTTQVNSCDSGLVTWVATD